MNVNENMKMTRQGIRDLNYYGPKRVPEAPDAPKAVEDATVVPTPPVAAADVAPQPTDNG
jgi:hypothetical protein